MPNGVQVRGGDDPFDIPIYTLCRRWVRNDPYNDETSLAIPKVPILLVIAFRPLWTYVSCILLC